MNPFRVIKSMCEFIRICTECGVNTEFEAEVCRACALRQQDTGTRLLIEAVKVKKGHTCQQVLSIRDYAVLEWYLHDHGQRDGFIDRQVRMKIADSRILVTSSLPDNVVTLNSRIVVNVAEQGPQSRTLTRWDSVLSNETGVSIVSPLGLALLGLGIGETVTITRRDGSTIAALLEDVNYQPEAARRANRYIAMTSG